MSMSWRNPAGTRPSKNRGYTLIQLIFAISIAGVMLAMVFSTYAKYARDARLEEAKGVLMRNSQELERFYMKNHTYKKNSTTWMPLPYTSTSHYCVRMVGNARGAAGDVYTIKAVAFDKEREPRIIRINHNHTIIVCQSSRTTCDEQGNFFNGTNGIDKECRIMN